MLQIRTIRQLGLGTSPIKMSDYISKKNLGMKFVSTYAIYLDPNQSEPVFLPALH